MLDLDEDVEMICGFVALTDQRFGWVPPACPDPAWLRHGRAGATRLSDISGGRSPALPNAAEPALGTRLGR